MHEADIPFLEAFLPWLATAHRRLQEQAGSLLERVTPPAQHMLDLSLLQRWNALCSPSMYNELRIDRLMNPSSEDPMRRLFLDPQALEAYWRTYPEVHRLVQLYTQFWVTATTELFERIDRDAALLSSTFCGHCPLGKIVNLHLGAGDLHHQGRSVCLITFECGKSVVYKPKNLDIIQQFNQCLQEINDLGFTPPLQSYGVLPRGDYGWEEKVEQAACKDVQAVERYFQRAGALLCLLFLFEGTDIHAENLIASGEFPICIDLETLFHTQLTHITYREEEKQLVHSVLRTDLLPLFVFRHDHAQGSDHSGLGKTDPSSKPDSMPSHQVRLGSQVIHACEHVESIVAGFRAMYSWVQNRPTWLHRVTSRMRSMRVRIILRDTQFYASLLQRLNQTSFSPESAASILSLLEQPFKQKLAFPSYVVAQEKRDLLQGDIPCFHTFPSSQDLYVNEQCIGTHCVEPYLTRTLSEEDRLFQEALIRHTFVIKQTNVHAEGTAHAPSATHNPSSSNWLQQALAIAHDLRRRAVVSPDGTLGWLLLDSYLRTEQYYISPTSLSLYGGRAGIALFFAALYRVTRDAEWAHITRLTVTPLLQLIDTHLAQVIDGEGIGGMSGAGGILYALLHISRCLNETSYIEVGSRLIRAIEPKHLEEDVYYDVIAGSAGLCLAALAFHQHTADARALALATLCGQHLQRRARNMTCDLERSAPAMCAWGQEERPKLGFSHGTAGVAYALCRLAQRTGEGIYAEIAQQALQYERFHFSPDEKNWPRFYETYMRYSCSWCHGATGIGLSRLALMSIQKDDLFSQEIHAALETAQASLPHSEHKLCCGLLGHLEFLRAAEKQGFHPVETGLAYAYQALQENSPTQFYNPGLMQGTSGIGYTLLRLVDDTLPQVLLLEG